MHPPRRNRHLWWCVWWCICWCLCSCCVLCADWRSCASPAAAFDIQGITLQPEVVPPGGSLSLVVDVNNKQPSVTAGSGTVKVYYYGWWVLTASGSMCDAPPGPQHAHVSPTSSINSISIAHRRMLLSSSTTTSWPSRTWLASPGSAEPQMPPGGTAAAAGQQAQAHVQDATCVMPAGPLQLFHQATLPGIAPRGNYRMQLSASDVNTGMKLFCLDVWFKVA